MSKKIIKRLLSGTLAAFLIAAMVPVSISENLLGGIGEVKAASVTYIPMTIASGFNADCIYDSGETLNNQDAADQDNKLSVGGYCFYSANYNSTGGLPKNRVVSDVSGNASGLSWTLGDYKSNNDMRLSPGKSGTFTFNTVGVYQKVYFLVTAGGIPGSSATMSTTINYSSGSASTSNFTVVDWYSSTNQANKTYKRISSSGPDGSTTGGPYFTRCSMALDTTRLVNSITIKNTASSGIINVYAVTGETAAVAAPTGLTLEGCAALNATWTAVSDAASYRIDIATDQNFTQIVGDYNNKTLTTNSCQVKGLSTGVQYYARVRAVDSSGGQGPSSAIVDCQSAYSFTYSAVDNKFESHCTIDGCEYDKDHQMIYTLKAEDTVYNRKQVPATLSGENTSFFTAATGYTVGEINYYKTSSYGSTSETGAFALGTTAPRDVGYYFAKVTFTKGGSSYSIVKPYKIYLEDANFAQESLNNRFDEEKQQVTTKVRGDSATSNLRVVLNSQYDQIKLYKIGDMYYNENNRDYDDITWDTDAVTDWLASSSYAGNSAYRTPKSIDDMTGSLQNQFYADMMTEEVKDATLVADTDGSNGVLDENTNTYYFSFENLNFGRYLVLATNSGGASYTPVVVDIIPYQNGPHTDWYVQSEFTAYLKEVVAEVNKFINGHDISDAVNIGDEVVFKIDVSLPSMYSDRATIGEGTTDYTLELVDDMSDAYALSGTPFLTYSIEKANLADIPFVPSNVYPYYEFANYNVSGSTHISDNPTSEEIATYSYDGNGSHIAGLYAVERSGNLYNITSTENTDGTTTIVAAFNTHALKSYIKNQLGTMGLDSSDVIVSLNYTAIVTEKIKLNSDENINTAAVRFEKSTGDVDSTTDVVYGYTYGLKVVKQDGSDENTFLAGAQFRLFKEQDVYIKHDGDEDFEWIKRIGSDATVAPEDALTYAEAKEAFDDTGLNSGVYLINESFDQAGTTESGVDYVAGDEICRLFVVYDDVFNTNTNALATNGEFTSVATAEGILLTGLSDGTYIMAEIQAPSGYNELAEDMMFAIYRMEDEEAAQYHHGSLRSFYEKAADGTMELNESGMIALTVLNYRGLTLPSTGGMGTLIFTILGILIMGAIIVVLIIRRRNTTKDYM